MDKLIRKYMYSKGYTLEYYHTDQVFVYMGNLGGGIEIITVDLGAGNLTIRQECDDDVPDFTTWVDHNDAASTIRYRGGDNTIVAILLEMHLNDRDNVELTNENLS